MSALHALSATLLGMLSNPDLCPRCTWMKLKKMDPVKFIFPPVFSKIDSVTKNTVNAFFSRHNRLPGWLSEIGDVVDILPSVSWQSFKAQVHPLLQLHGTPDHMFLLSDGTIVIVDYKTSDVRPAEDPMHARYAYQLNTYRVVLPLCADKKGNLKYPGRKVSKLYLCYTAPCIDADPNRLLEDRFSLDFSPSLVPVEILDVQPLVSKALSYLALETPPSSAEKCKDCATIDAVVRTLSSHVSAVA